MSMPGGHPSDERWRALFASADVELAADPFVGEVLRRVNRGRMARWLVLAAAAAAGGLVAFGPLTRSLVSLGRWLALNGTSLSSLGTAFGLASPLWAVLLTAAWLGALRALSR